MRHKNPRLYPPEELTVRLHTWGEINGNDPNNDTRRLFAWCRYCDVRDNLPEGTTFAKAHVRYLDQEQIDMFSKETKTVGSA